LKVKEKRYYFSLRVFARSMDFLHSCANRRANGAEGRAELCIELISWALSAWTQGFLFKRATQVPMFPVNRVREPRTVITHIGQVYDIHAHSFLSVFEENTVSRHNDA